MITIPALDPLPNSQVRRGRHSPLSSQDRHDEEQVQEQQAGQGSGEPVEFDVEVDVDLHHGTVLTICGIIADNAFDRVFLSNDRDCLSRADEHCYYDDILPAGEYWLQVTPTPVNLKPNEGAGSLQVVPREERLVVLERPLHR